MKRLLPDGAPAKLKLIPAGRDVELVLRLRSASSGRRVAWGSALVVHVPDLGAVSPASGLLKIDREDDVATCCLAEHDVVVHRVREQKDLSPSVESPLASPSSAPPFPSVKAMSVIPAPLMEMTLPSLAAAHCGRGTKCSQPSGESPRQRRDSNVVVVGVTGDVGVPRCSASRRFRRVNRCLVE